MLIRRIARPMLSAVFIGRGVDALRSPKPAADAARPTLEGLSKLPDPVGTNVPSDAETVARINGMVQIAGGLLLATGKLPRVASATLAVTVIPGSLGGHMFWNETDAQRKVDERRAFLTDVSLIGGLIIAAADTAGKPSLGWRSRQAAHKVSGAVSAALPAGAAAGGALGDSQLVEKLEHGLHVGAEKGREFAHVAKERGTEFAEVARDRAPELAAAARDRGSHWAEVAKEKAPEIAEAARGRAEVARERGAELADVARDRAPELAATARERRSEFKGLARARAAEARSRADDLADTARKEAKHARRELDKQRKKRR